MSCFSWGLLQLKPISPLVSDTEFHLRRSEITRNRVQIDLRNRSGNRTTMSARRVGDVEPLLGAEVELLPATEVEEGDEFLSYSHSRHNLFISLLIHLSCGSRFICSNNYFQLSCSRKWLSFSALSTQLSCIARFIYSNY